MGPLGSRVSRVLRAQSPSVAGVGVQGQRRTTQDWQDLWGGVFAPLRGIDEGQGDVDTLCLSSEQRWTTRHSFIFNSSIYGPSES